MLEPLRTRLSSLSRHQKRLLQVCFDFLALFAVAWLAYVLRLGSDFAPNFSQMAFMALAPLLAIPFFVRLGLYRAVLRYLPERAAWTIVKAMVLATLAWVAAVFLFQMSGGEGVPRSIPIIYCTLGILVIGGSRYLAKALVSSGEAAEGDGKALIYGAGKAGTQLAAALRAANDRSIAGFVDDNPALQGQDIGGLRVFDPTGLAELVERLAIRDIILCIPSASPSRRLELVSQLSRLPVNLRTLPAISDIASGKYAVSRLKEVEIEDLLGRSSVAPDLELMASTVRGQRILVTGAGGSIGSELCRQIARLAPAELLLVEMSEYALYQIHRTLTDAAPALAITPLLGSVNDQRFVENLFANRDIDMVLHAAAYKHVPLLESNVIAAVRNNIGGTFTVAQAAYESGVKRFVVISTDKAVHPSSVMGATKRWSELIARHFSEQSQSVGSDQRFCAVRFGNVLGSTGSVVPLFREQIARGGPVTVTDFEMTRFFMAISEAAELILQAAGLAQGGEIFLLDMGKPISIRALAENMVTLAGLEIKSAENPDGDIEIREIGIRPGEKMHEALYYDPDNARETAHPKIQRARRQAPETIDICAAYATLQEHLSAGDPDAVERAIFALIGANVRDLRDLRQSAEK